MRASTARKSFWSKTSNFIHVRLYLPFTSFVTFKWESHWPFKVCHIVMSSRDVCKSGKNYHSDRRIPQHECLEPSDFERRRQATAGMKSAGENNRS
jgi:hypothetical protein